MDEFGLHTWYAAYQSQVVEVVVATCCPVSSWNAWDRWVMIPTWHIPWVAPYWEEAAFPHRSVMTVHVQRSRELGTTSILCTHIVLLLCFLDLSLGGCNLSLKQSKFCIQIRHSPTGRGLLDFLSASSARTVTLEKRAINYVG